MTTRARHRKGRGAASNPAGRFESTIAVPADDGWGILEEPQTELATTVLPEPARSVISRNDSPDVPFDQSINPYRGCEHGCVYCFARPTHAYVNLSPGLDFETRLFYKRDAARLLAAELAAPGYRCRPITLGANTDPYQPIERHLRVTRELLEVMVQCRHPVSIVTKGTLIARDLDLLSALAAAGLAQVMVSVTTLENSLKRTMEPRAASPAARLAVIRALSSAGVPTGVMVAPVIPALNDHELERILAAAAGAGARFAGYVVLRLPREVGPLFREWLALHYPHQVRHVFDRLRDMRGGGDNDARFGHRMRGQGPFAALLRRRFDVACRRLGLARAAGNSLRTELFVAPKAESKQFSLAF